MVFDLLTPVQGKFCRHAPVSRWVTGRSHACTAAPHENDDSSSGCMHVETPIEVNWWKWSPIYTQVHELIFSLSFYVNFAVHLAHLMALRKHTQPSSATMPMPPHRGLKWKISFGKWYGWNNDRKIIFCIPLDFLDIKDSRKNIKGQWRSWRPNQRPEAE